MPVTRCSVTRMVDTARSSKGRIAELQTALSKLAASPVAMTELLRDYYGGHDKAQDSLDGSK